MSLRARFLLLIVGAAAITIGVASWLITTREEALVMDGLRKRASMALTVSEACRASFPETLTPILKESVKNSKGATGARGILLDLRRRQPDYHFREASLNPLNSGNRADPTEAGIIEYFKANAFATEVSGKVGPDKYERLYLARPIRAKAQCLNCHGSPRRAPAGIIRKYGTDHGYGWKEGDVVGTLIVTSPVRNGYPAGYVTAAWPIAGLFCCLGLVAAWTFYRAVARRLTLLSNGMARVAKYGDFSIRLRETSKDELGSAMRDFDEMVRKVSAAQSSLEGQIHARTESLQRSAAEMRAIFQATGEGILSFDSTGNIIMANNEAEKMWGYANNGLIGLPIGALVGEADETVPGAWLKRYLNSGANIGIRTELIARQYDGSPFPMEMRISETLTGDKRIYTACVRDISDRKRAEGRLRLLSSVAQESLSGILIMDLEEHIVFANPAFERLSGYRSETVIGSRLESFLFGPDTAYHSRRILRDAFDARTPAKVEIVQYHSNGSPFWTEMHVAPVPDARGRITHFVAVVNDISERKKLEAERELLLEDAERRAETDVLTDLYNHRAMQDRLQTAMDQTRAEGKTLAVAMMDVTDFKLFNDVYGHVIGDRVLRMVGECLRTVAPPEYTLCRYGGDEFLILMPETSVDQAEWFLNRLQDHIMNRKFVPKEGERHVPVRLAWGVALFPEEATGRLDLLARADSHMYQFKRRGQPALRLHRPEGIEESEAMDTLWSLVNAVDNKDKYTRRHSEEVAEYACMIGRGLGMSDNELRVIWRAGMVHDVGKIGVPDHVLRKPGKLEPDEWEAMQQHPVIGKRLVEAFAGLEETLPAVLHHHEKWDGSGYPAKLAGEDIPYIARIMAVADVYSALTTARPYRYGMEPEKALEVLIKDSGTHFDPNLVPIFVKAMRESLGQVEELKLAA